MFEKLRTNFARRLGRLIERYDAIEQRAQAHIDDELFAARAGLSTGEGSAVFEEIALKSNEQGDLCADALQGLLGDRVSPLIFWRGVGRAERFASECERVLDMMDLATQVGKRAVRSRFGITD